MSFCLPKEQVDKFIQALKDGVIDPGKLSEMSSAERRSFFEKIVGEADAKEVNALFESKLLLKNQQAGMIAWAKKVGGITESARRDLITKIQKMDRVLTGADEQSFLADLASKKLGTDVSLEEAQQIADLAKQATEAKVKIDPSEPIGSANRLEYGAAKAALQELVGQLKVSNDKFTFKGTLEDLKSHPYKTIKKLTVDILGFSKAFNAAFDNSFWGRQGFKAIATHPRAWITDFGKSFKDMAKQVTAKGEWYKSGDDAVMHGIKADIYSRPNAINGLYELGKFDLLVKNEEAYPTSLPEKIPLVGRIFKASEVAYTGAALRLRAEIADTVLAKAQQAGVDLTNPVEVQSIGKMVNAMTGRGYLGKLEVGAKELNVAFFSPRSLKSNFDFLTAHQLQDNVSPFVRRQAALNLAKTAALVGTVMLTAKALGYQVEMDPRSADFGKIRVGKTTFDVTGGMGSMVTLTSRMLTQSSKSTTTHKVNPLNSGKYGSQTVKNVFVDYFTNKLSPGGQVVNDVLLTGRTFQGQKPTVLGEVQNLFEPLPIKNITEVMSTPGGANAFITGFADGLGFVTNTNQPKKK